MFAFDDGYEAFDSTPLSNLFITDHLPGATGEQLKVYLYGLMRSLHPKADFALPDLAKALEMEPAEVENAFRHWEFAGLVVRVSENPPQYRFLHPSQVGREDSAGAEDRVYADFMESLYSAFGGKRDLHGSEKRKAWEWVEELHLAPEVVLILIKHLIRTQGINFRFLGKEANRLALMLVDGKAADAADALEILGREEEIDSGARAVLRRFRQRRLPSADELALYRKWRDEWSFTGEQILEACAETTKGTPSFAYLDAILRGIRERTAGTGATMEEDREEQDRVREMLRALGLSGVGVNTGTLAAYRQMTEMYPHETVLLAARELSTRRSKGLDVLTAMLESWKEKGLAPESVPDYIAAFNRENDLIRRLNKLWEADLVRAGETSRAAVRTWTKDWGYSPALILYVAAFAGVNEKRSPMAYLNSLLKSFHDKGLTGEAEIAAEHERWARENSAVAPAEAHRKAEKAIAQLQYGQREYEETKPGELPAWYLQMLEDERNAE